jgi:hypothetical protein
MGRIKAASRDSHAADAGVIVGQRAQGGPDELYEVERVWEEGVLPERSERFSANGCMYYPPSMPSLITKWKKGRPYLYWVRSARVKGQSRIVEQIYLGPQERVMEHIRVQRTAAAPQGAMPTLHTVQTREFGASALFYT